MRKLDHNGKRFGQLLVLRRSAIKGRNAYWICRCDCGNERAVCAGHLTTGKITTCGCLRRRIVSQKLTKHGHRRANTPEYMAWINAKMRCENANRPHWDMYGGRGIRMCDRWRHNFSAFLADMGVRPSPNHSIDRIDNDGDYEPSNCRWATASEQALNRRPKRWWSRPK